MEGNKPNIDLSSVEVNDNEDINANKSEEQEAKSLDGGQDNQITNDSSEPNMQAAECSIFEKQETLDSFQDVQEEDYHSNDQTDDTEQKEAAVSTNNYIRLRGLPFNSAEEDIMTFLDGIKVVDVIILTGRDGRPSGEAYCQLEANEDVSKALEFDKGRMENRYIEVFTVSEKDIAIMKARGVPKDQGNVVRLRGLPYTSNVQDVREFLNGLDCEEVVIGRSGGRPSGEAFVRLASKEQATKALEYNKKSMGTRYIEIFRTTADDLARHRQDHSSGYNKKRERGPPSLMSFTYPRPPRAFDGSYELYWEEERRGPYNRGGGSYRHEPYSMRPRDECRYRGRERDYYIPPKVYMRGIPFDADAREIEHFFYPLHCQSIMLGYNAQNRASGDACIEFSSVEEANEALRRNNKHMGRRYVELFPYNDMPPSMRQISWKCVSEAYGPPRNGPQPAPTPRARNYEPSYSAGTGGYNGFENQYEQYDSYTNYESYNNYGPPRRPYGGRQPYY